MKISSKLFSRVLTFLLVLSLLTTAFASDSVVYEAGVYSDTQLGFGGKITVTLTFDEASITAVEVVGDSESAGIGSDAVEKLPQEILAAQSAQIDDISGATVSSKAILVAAQNCINAATGKKVDTTGITLIPGTYSASAIGYFKLNPVTVSVTVDENKIESIVIEDGHDESYGMVQSIKANLLPRMVENNSVTIDAVTGATVTSNAVKSATTKALNIALTQAGYEGIDATTVFNGQVPKTNETITLDTDVLIIGLGGSGLAALASSTQNADGMGVIAVEKAGIFGGTSQMTCDVFAMNPTNFKNERNGGKDYQDPKPMRDAWLEYTTSSTGEQLAKVEIIDLLFAESGNTVDWLIEYCGFAFRDPVGGFTATDNYITKFQYTNGYSIASRTETSGYFKAMVERAQEKGAQILLETEAYELLTDANGAVVGAKAHNLVNGNEYTINAKAVIDATGGFAGNQKMMQELIDSEYFCFDAPFGVVGSMQNDGKIMRSAIEIGAATYNMDMPPEWHNAATPKLLSSYEVVAAEEGDKHNMFLPQAYSLNDLPTILGSSANVLQVNKLGKRFDAETVMFRRAESGSQFYGIQSEASLKAIQEEGLTSQRYSGFVNIGGWHLNQPIPELFDIVEEAIDLGICYKADTLPELAELTGIPTDELLTTIARYNELCAKGIDEDFGKDSSFMEPIAEEGPYYAFVIQEYIYNTLGGLDINEKMEVLDTEGNAIAGLYAVGNESTGVLFSNEKVYPTYGGMDMSWCYTSGRLAGLNAIDFIKGAA